MKPEEVRNLNWVKVKDWNNLIKTHYGKDGKRYIGKEDINNFVENIFRDISRKLEISSKELIPLLKEENVSFYETIERIYSKYSGLGGASDEFEEIKGLLIIPDISLYENKKISADLILKQCSELSNEDKERIIDGLNSELKKNFRLDAQKLIEYFNSLPDIEKFNLMKYLGLFEVKVEIIKPR